MNALTVNGFGFAYPEKDEVFSDISFCLEEGAFSLLTGATGSGKTTLLRSIKPQLAPTGNKRGVIEVFGRTLDSFNSQESASTIGYVSQSPDNQIVCDTVWHELAFGLENLGVEQGEMRRRVAEIAYFFGIEPIMNELTSKLSGGQKQAITLASILVMQPKLLLLDEPTAQLDPVAEKNFLHALFRINRELGITVLIATHNPEAMSDYATSSFHLTPHIGGDKPPTIVPPCHPPSCHPERLFCHPEAQPKDSWIVTSLSSKAPHNDIAVPCHPEAQPSCHPEAQPKDPSPCPLSVCDAFFRYTPNTPWVLRGFDLNVSAGSIHAVVGGNGSGKSTLLNLIAGTLKPARGKIINNLLDSQALLPQNPQALFVCDSVDEELREWQKTSEHKSEELKETIQRFGLSALLKQHPYDLSGGEQQKLALAKLMLTTPQLLLLDEPTKGLDAETKRDLGSILCELKNKGTTIVLSTHDLSFISQVADKVTMLFDGQTSCTENTSEFFENNLFYRPKKDEFLKRWRQLQEANSS